MEFLVRAGRILEFFSGRVSTEPLLEDDFRPNICPPPLRGDLGGPRLLDLSRQWGQGEGRSVE